MKQSIDRLKSRETPSDPLGRWRREQLLSAMESEYLRLTAPETSLGQNQKSSRLSNGIDLFKAGKYEAALVQLQSACHDDPENCDALVWLGYAQRYLGQRAAARTTHERALAIDPNHAGNLTFLGELLFVEGDRATAKQYLNRAVGLVSEQIEKHGPSQLCMRLLSVSLNRVGDVELAEGDRAAALEKYRKSLQLSEQIVRDFGESPQSLRDVSVSLDGVGDVELAEGDRAAALEKYRKSLQLREQIVRDFGESPQSLRDVSVSLNRVGDVERAEGDRAAALDKYRKSLQLCEQIVRDFGESPESLRDVSVSLNRVGDVELAEGDRAETLEKYRKSLQLCEQIVRDFGESPQSLRDVSVSLDRVGDVELAEGDRAAALEKYRKSLQLCEQIVRAFGESPQSLDDLVLIHGRVGAAIDLPRAAAHHLEAARRFLNQINERGWGDVLTPSRIEWLRNQARTALSNVSDERSARGSVAASAECPLAADNPLFNHKLAGILLAENRWSEALPHLRRSLTAVDGPDQGWVRLDDLIDLGRAALNPVGSQSSTLTPPARDREQLAADLVRELDEAGLRMQIRPLYEALKAVAAGSIRYLNRVAPEVATGAKLVLKRWEVDLPDKPSGTARGPQKRKK